MQLIESDANKMKFELQEDAPRGARIKVVGVGGGGSNAVGRMFAEGLTGVEFHVMNTDIQALMASNVPSKIQIGAKMTGGLGAGADPAIGRQAALEDTERILELLHGADMVFVAAGLGGGTGAGAAPVIASLAKELDALTVAVVTKPFSFEGPKRMRQAERCLEDLAATVDTLITIPNERLLAIAPRGTTFKQAFGLADDVLRQAVQGISDIIVTPGIINLDFSDIRATMLGMGHAMMGTATASGPNAALEAARQAINSPLLEGTRIAGSRRVLINLTGSPALGLHEVSEACSIIREASECDDVQISFGVITDERMGDTVKVTVVATGFQLEKPAEIFAVGNDFFAQERAEAAPAVEAPPAVHTPPATPGLPERAMAIQMEDDEDFEETDSSDSFDHDDLETPAYVRRGLVN